ncbi:hypothetical protein [Streptomyces microflavus]
MVFGVAPSAELLGDAAPDAVGFEIDTEPALGGESVGDGLHPVEAGT